MEKPAVVVFLHAHPDDEAIFTGGTMALLAAQGHRVVLCVATAGEGGLTLADEIDLASARRAETLTCCEALGVSDTVFLDFADSGLAGENPDGFAHVNVMAATEHVIKALAPYGNIDALVSYDDHGIYGHPDHVQVYRVGRAVCARMGIETRYESTVDREYLHFVETHVVVEAGLGSRPVGRGLAASQLGMPSLLIDVTVDARTALDTKKIAMAAHASQLPADAPAFALGQQNFAAVYGYEWFVRHGPASVIDDLPLA